MTTDKGRNQTLEETIPEAKPGVYSPVQVRISESIGAFFLGIVALVLLVALLKAETRYRGLLSQLSAQPNF